MTTPPGGIGMSLTFTPKTRLSNNKVGLATTPDSVSLAVIESENLTDGMTVTVLSPPDATNDPTYKWTGTTMQTHGGGTKCRVLLTQTVGVSKSQDPGGPREIPNVSVTVGSPTTTTTTVVPLDAPLAVVSGSYTVKCCATSGENLWLNAGGVGVVNLANENATPQPWTIAVATNPTGGFYTLQNSSVQVNNANVTQYLNWTLGGVVSLVSSLVTGTSWQLLTQADGTLLVLAPNAPQYLNGNTSGTSVTLVTAPDASKSQSWAITTAQRR